MRDDTLFQLAEVNDAIAGTEFHRCLTHLPTVPSTMDLAAEAARSGARRGVWIADEQTAGRGRGAHTWHSEPGAGLYMTALTSPPLPVQSALRLSFRVAIGVQAAIAATTGLRIREQIDIRWPNDLMLSRPNAPARKCGGILIDTASEPASPPRPATLRYALIGIGINLNHLSFPPELDPIATSLRRELPGQPLLRREPLTAAILRELDATIRTLTTGDRATDDFTAHSSWLTGKRVRIEPRSIEPRSIEPRPGDLVDSDPAAASYTGTTAGLDPNGFLRVLDDDGQLRTVLSGGLREL
jgi:BirA family biotin operon repressor/biotin-[acetyl-CoA-carboxylase] ligase